MNNKKELKEEELEGVNGGLEIPPVIMNQYYCKDCNNQFPGCEVTANRCMFCGSTNIEVIDSNKLNNNF